MKLADIMVESVEFISFQYFDYIKVNETNLVLFTKRCSI